MVTKEGGANGKIKVLAFEAGVNGKYSSAQTQKIKIKLDVTDKKGGKKQVSRTERIK